MLAEQGEEGDTMDVYDDTNRFCFFEIGTIQSKTQVEHEDERKHRPEKQHFQLPAPQMMSKFDRTTALRFAGISLKMALKKALKMAKKLRYGVALPEGSDPESRG